MNLLFLIQSDINIDIFSRDDPRYNLASELYSPRWEEGLYRLYETGHCHTFNPENFSLAGLQGLHYLNLGMFSIWQQPS